MDNSDSDATEPYDLQEMQERNVISKEILTFSYQQVTNNNENCSQIAHEDDDDATQIIGADCYSSLAGLSPPQETQGIASMTAGSVEFDVQQSKTKQFDAKVMEIMGNDPPLVEEQDLMEESQSLCHWNDSSELINGTQATQCVNSLSMKFCVTQEFESELTKRNQSESSFDRVLSPILYATQATQLNDTSFAQDNETGVQGKFRVEGAEKARDDAINDLLDDPESCYSAHNDIEERPDGAGGEWNCSPSLCETQATQPIDSLSMKFDLTQDFEIKLQKESKQELFQKYSGKLEEKNEVNDDEPGTETASQAMSPPLCATQTTQAMESLSMKFDNTQNFEAELRGNSRPQEAEVNDHDLLDCPESPTLCCSPPNSLKEKPYDLDEGWNCSPSLCATQATQPMDSLSMKFDLTQEFNAELQKNSEKAAEENERDADSQIMSSPLCATQRKPESLEFSIDDAPTVDIVDYPESQSLCCMESVDQIKPLDDPESGWNSSPTLCATQATQLVDSLSMKFVATQEIEAELQKEILSPSVSLLNSKVPESVDIKGHSNDEDVDLVDDTLGFTQSTQEMPPLSLEFASTQDFQAAESSKLENKPISVPHCLKDSIYGRYKNYHPQTTPSPTQTTKPERIFEFETQLPAHSCKSPPKNAFEEETQLISDAIYEQPTQVLPSKEIKSMPSPSIFELETQAYSSRTPSPSKMNSLKNEKSPSLFSPNDEFCNPATLKGMPRVLRGTRKKIGFTESRTESVSKEVFLQETQLPLASVDNCPDDDVFDQPTQILSDQVSKKVADSTSRAAEQSEKIDDSVFLKATQLFSEKVTSSNEGSKIFLQDTQLPAGHNSIFLQETQVEKNYYEDSLSPQMKTVEEDDQDKQLRQDTSLSLKETEELVPDVADASFNCAEDTQNISHVYMEETQIPSCIPSSSNQITPDVENKDRIRSEQAPQERLSPFFNEPFDFDGATQLPDRGVSSRPSSPDPKTNAPSFTIDSDSDVDDFINSSDLDERIEQHEAHYLIESQSKRFELADSHPSSDDISGQKSPNGESQTEDRSHGVQETSFSHSHQVASNLGKSMETEIDESTITKSLVPPSAEAPENNPSTNAASSCGLVASSADQISDQVSRSSSTEGSEKKRGKRIFTVKTAVSLVGQNLQATVSQSEVNRASVTEQETSKPKRGRKSKASLQKEKITSLSNAQGPSEDISTSVTSETNSRTPVVRRSERKRANVLTQECCKSKRGRKKDTKSPGSPSIVTNSYSNVTRSSSATISDPVASVVTRSQLATEFSSADSRPKRGRKSAFLLSNSLSSVPSSSGYDRSVTSESDSSSLFSPRVTGKTAKRHSVPKTDLPVAIFSYNIITRSRSKILKQCEGSQGDSTGPSRPSTETRALTDDDDQRRTGNRSLNRRSNGQKELNPLGRGRRGQSTRVQNATADSSFISDSRRSRRKRTI